MINIIAAVSSNGVIGQNGTLPWSYPEDLKFFKQQTLNSTIIMGRKTFGSMGNKPLPKRTNIVISSQKLECNDDITIYTTSLDKAIFTAEELMKGLEPGDKKIWFIGGENIYREGMKYADTIILTLIPKIINGNNLTYFPWVDPSIFELSGISKMENSDLKIVSYYRIC